MAAPVRLSHIARKYALALAMAACMPVAAESTIISEMTRDGRLGLRQREIWQLDGGTGDFIRGHIDGEKIQLALVDRTGRQERLLADGTGPRQDFMFVVGNLPPYRLAAWIAPSAEPDPQYAHVYKLVIDELVKKADQHAPPTPELESPALRAFAAQRSQSEHRAQHTQRTSQDSDAFWDVVQRKGTPLIEQAGVVPPLDDDTVLATFLWRGARDNVRLFGAPSGDHDELARLGDSDIWYRSYRIPRSTRLGYRLAPDVPQLTASAPVRRRAILATAQRDPFNARSFPTQPLDKYTGESVLILPDTPRQEWVERRAEIPGGTLDMHRVASAILENTRDVYLYRSHGYRPGEAGNALVVLFDADKYITQVPTPTILDNLVAAGKLPPTAAILIGNASRQSRGAELPPNPAFAHFLATELMPWARAQGVYADAGHTVIAGSSFGGLAAAYAGMAYPELFGKVYSQSGSFWWSPVSGGDNISHENGAIDNQPEWLTREYARLPQKALAFYLEAGLFESGKQQQAGILESTRHLRDVLRAKGYAVQHVEYASGHDYLHWRGTLATGLTALLGQEGVPLE